MSRLTAKRPERVLMAVLDGYYTNGIRLVEVTGVLGGGVIMIEDSATGVKTRIAPDAFAARYRRVFPEDPEKAA